MEPYEIKDLWRFPVKSMGGERLDHLEFDADGELLLAISVELSGRGYRIVKYAPDVFDVAELRAGASSTQVLDGPP